MPDKLVLIGAYETPLDGLFSARCALLDEAGDAKAEYLAEEASRRAGERFLAQAGELYRVSLPAAVDR